MRKNSQKESTPAVIQYPKNERVMVGYYDAGDNLRFIITCKPSRDFYFLYMVSNDGFKKLGKDSDPSVLRDKFNVINTIRGE